MQLEAKKLLQDVRYAGKLIVEFVRGRELADYHGDALLRSAVERQLFIVGEAVSQLRKLEPELAASLPSTRNIVGFRNVLAHAYASVSDERVWDMVQNHLPALLEAVERLLEDPEAD